jgi:hypothetical protein
MALPIPSKIDPKPELALSIEGMDGLRNNQHSS